MRKLGVKKLLIILALIAIVTIIAPNVKVLAAGPLDINLPGSTTTNTTTTNTTTNTTTTNTTIGTTTNRVNTNTTTNIVGNDNQNSNLPQTGDASDYIVFLFIAVCAVVAIYAYRKYKNYNI